MPGAEDLEAASNESARDADSLRLGPDADRAENLNRHESSRRVQQSSREHHVTYHLSAAFGHKRQAALVVQQGSQVIDEGPLSPNWCRVDLSRGGVATLPSADR